MKSRFLRCLLAVVFGCLLLTLPAAAEQEEAENITSKSLIVEHSGFYNTYCMFNGYFADSEVYQPGSWFTIAHEEGFGSLYFIFDLETGGYTVTNNDTGETGRWGENGFLHEFVDLESYFGEAPKSVTVTFENGAAIVETFFFTSGQTPDFVQKWEPCADGKADLLVLSAHCDDEQLFLGGIIPLHAGGMDKTVQVVYLTDHRTMTRQRCREALDGLWAVGCRTYPVFGSFVDQLSTYKDQAYSLFTYSGVYEEDLVAFAVEQLRRFKPSVVATHDILGEYGHGQHMVCADIMMKASEISMDAEAFPESSRKYGIWDLPKLYLHLWKENQIVLNLDEPLECFDGRSAYEMTRDSGFPAHRTQYYDFAWYMLGHDTAASITTNSPCEYGLYRSTVGEDINKDDFFENIPDRIPEP